MRKQPAYKEPDARNSLCRALGHDWMTTAAANYRVCKRERCSASQRLANGQWVSNAQALRRHPPVVTSRTTHHSPRQSRMWGES